MYEQTERMLAAPELLPGSESLQVRGEGWLSGRDVVTLEEFINTAPVIPPGRSATHRGEEGDRLLLDTLMAALKTGGFREWHPFDPLNPKWKRAE
jgi:hypothetical protein